MEVAAKVPPPDLFLAALAKRSFKASLRNTVIDSSPEPRPFGEVAEPWQWADYFDPIAPAVEHLCQSEEEARNKPPYSGPKGFWNTKPRGSAKTSAIAMMCNHILAHARKRVPVRISVAASDQKQAKLVRDSMFVQAKLNPWFGNNLQINRYDAEGPGGRLEILSADAGSAYGGASDIIICDELTHWPPSGQALWVALTSEGIKKPMCVMFVITNAGYQGTWQWNALQQYRQDPDWHVVDKPGYVASWVDAKRIESTRQQILASTGSAQEALRLLDNIWVSSRAGAVFQPELVSAISDPDAPTPLLWQPA